MPGAVPNVREDLLTRREAPWHFALGRDLVVDAAKYYVEDKEHEGPKGPGRR